MAWNGPIDGDWTTCDFTKAPFAAGIMTLTHEEVLYVIEALPPIEAQYSPDANMIISKYNQLSNWEKAINGDTYNCIKTYDPAVNTLGIDAQGIIQPPAEEVTPEGV